MIDHLGFDVSDYARSRAFYSHVLAPLGYGVVMEVTREMTGGYEGCGFGPPSRPHFWVGKGGGTPGRGMHIAFTAQTRAQVDAFHAAALAAGAQDNGAPGLRPHYHPDYYGAFVIDPDGNNVEAVCHLPADAQP
ncbi:VOC family protein [Pseudoxanthomonas sp. SL93]|uniref:VOC family protein n=1 Tax=Pseudoxanthomonas sp. SL93 TaxID=2995142 RepID=UPI002270B427|nr:VOC family protein [Pseudoxanthomonas sp. SL93]WAC64313.1 VOC family protein [Pseudoxanthomonas sp. SL93]